MELDYAGSSQGNHKGNYKGQPPWGNCHICGKSGYWKRECPQGNTGNNNNYKGNNNNNYKGNNNNYKGKGKFNNLEETSLSTSPPNYNNNLELTNAEENQERLLRVNGKINGHSAWILLDSGASRNFLDEQFVHRCKISTQVSPPVTIELADGRKQETNHSVRIKDLSLSSYHTTGISTQVIKIQ